MKEQCKNVVFVGGTNKSDREPWGNSNFDDKLIANSDNSTSC